MSCPSSPTEEDAIVKETLDLIDQGWGKIVHSQSQCSINVEVKQGVTFALGGTGAGKSTLTQIITENLHKLHAVSGKHGCGLVIVDKIENTAEGRIGDPQVASKTFLPEYLVCADDPNLVFVDCPGFNDNRGIHMDIASMVLIKKIAEQVTHARFLFVIPSSSVSYSNINRNDFISLCTHATSFVKNLDKIKQAMSLVITKVNNCDPATGQAIEDHAVIHETSVFLEEVSNQQSTSVENRYFIQCLLDNKSKWVLIRYPNKMGPLNEMYHFVQVRKEIRDTCQRKLKAVPVTPDDFAITLSADSKYIIARRLIPYMRGEIAKIVARLLADMEVMFVVRFQRELQTQKPGLVVTLMKNLEQICDKLNQTGSKQEVRVDGNVLLVTNKVVMAENWLQINLPKRQLTELRNMEEKLYLFQQVTGENDSEEDNSSSVFITNAFNVLKTNLEELHKSTMSDVKSKLVPTVETVLQEEAINVVKLFGSKYTDSFWTSLESAEEYGLQTFEKIGKDWMYFETLENCGFGSAGETISCSLRKFTSDMQVSIERDSFAKLEELESELEILLELIGQSGRGPSIGANLIPEIRKVFRSVRKQAHAIVRDKYIKMVNEKVQQQTNTLMCSLEETFFNENIYPGLNIESIGAKRELMNSIHADLQQCQKSFNNNGISHCVLEMFKIFGKELPETEEKCLREYESILDFYDNVLGSPVARPFEEWMTPVRSLVESIYDTAALYEFLELAMSTNPNTVDEDLTFTDGDEDKLILRFLGALRATSDIRRTVLHRARSQDKQLIKNIAKYLQSGKTNLKFADGKKMLVKGRHVKFSDFLNESGWLRGCYSLPVTKVLVMCSGTVYLDRDLMGRGQQLTCTVIADKWVVQGGKRFIDLSGCDGIPHQERKARDGKEYGESGDDGFPGNCGGNGGNFFGIYNKIVNGGSLYIFSNGGTGGDGQSGGDGGVGCPGRDAEYPIPTAKTKSTLEILRSILLPGPFSILTRYGPFDSTILPGPPNPIVAGLSFPAALANSDPYSDSIVPKKAGGNGGRGGDGGVGGNPGFPGVVKLFSLASVASIVNVSCSKGKPGRPGKGGDGGRGGRNGHQDPRHGPSGRSGRTGKNSRRLSRSSPQGIKDLDWRDVEEFRKYIMEECEGCSAGLRFLHLIDNDLEISRRHANL